MKMVSTCDAKATLSALLDRVAEHGEEFVITRHGKPVAKLIPVESKVWVPCFDPAPEGMRVRCAPGEDIAPVYPDGIPWHDQDPV